MFLKLSSTKHIVFVITSEFDWLPWQQKDIIIADILTKVFRKYLLSGSPPNVYFVSKPLKLISCHDNQNAKFLKKKKN